MCVCVLYVHIFAYITSKQASYMYVEIVELLTQSPRVSPHICFIINLQPIAWTHPVLVTAHVCPASATARRAGEVTTAVLSTKMCSNACPDVLTTAFTIWTRVHVSARNIGRDQIVRKVSVICSIPSHHIFSLSS